MVTAALVAAVAVFTLLSLPPAPFTLDTSWSDGSVPGVFHIHTNRSDGRSSPEEVAAAAAAAGLKFVVFTDHGDATRKPDPPLYRSGVLCMDGVEISTANGHYLVFDMGAAPYPLGGEARDVVEDVRRLGGFGIAAHPTSPKSDLSWSEWTVPVDGLELINPDTSWRVHMFDAEWRGRRKIVRSLLTYPFRSSETIGALLTDSTALEARWTELAARRRVVAIAGVDAHARLELRAGDHGADGFSLPVPGYEPSFRTLSVHVFPSGPLTGDAPADARLVADGVRQGRVYTAVDAWATPPQFEFTLTNAKGSAQAGGELAVSGPVTVRVRSNAPPSFRTSLLRDGDAIVTDSVGRDFTATADGRPGVYRVEIRSPERPAGPAWLISNPVYLRSGEPARSALLPMRATAQLPLFDGRSETGWSTEHDAESLAAIEAVQMVGGVELRLRYGLAGGPLAQQYAGAAVGTPQGVASYDRATMTVRAERPMRLSIQVRAEFKDAPAERWQRSIYVDTADRQLTVAFDDMRAVGQTRSEHPPLADVRALMFIVDTTNNKPGASGRVWITSVRLERSSTPAKS
jgi:hypothetical protein